MKMTEKWKFAFVTVCIEFHPLLGKQLSSAFLSFLVVVVVRRRRRHNRVLDLGETRQTNSTVKLEQ